MEKMLKATTNKNRNGFQKHSIDHLSSSSVNKAREAFDVWLVDKLGGAKFPTNFSMWQGKAVELGVDQNVYSGKEIDFCIRSALDYFSKHTNLLPNYAEEYAKREPIIKRMVQTGIQQLRTIGVPKQPTLGEQHKIEIPVRFAEGDLGTIPVIGFLDYWFPEENIIVDLKTTAKAPSKWTLSHAIQASLYKKAMEKETGKPVKVLFLYVLSRQKDPFVWLELDDPTSYLKSFKRTVMQMEAFLSDYDDLESMLKRAPHNPDSFYWNGAEDVLQQYYP
tara:strand:- start:1557 stop:2387 length:831 start_codon:yes stop_codon:yes gene_type:complete